jgi:putative hydrolase of the HAD superfamily
MIKKTILFDLFGTLIMATSPELIIIDKFSLNPEKHDGLQRVVCGIDFHNQCHKNMSKYLKAVVKEAGIEENKENLEELKKIYEGEFEKAILFPESKKVLEELKSEGYTLGLISNAYPPTRQRLLDKNGLTGCFDKIFLSYEMGMTKQMPAFYKVALSQLETNAEDAIMIGDSLKSDILASKKATDDKIGGILISKESSSISLERFFVVPELSKVPKAVAQLFD